MRLLARLNIFQLDDLIEDSFFVRSAFSFGDFFILCRGNTVGSIVTDEYWVDYKSMIREIDHNLLPVIVSELTLRVRFNVFGVYHLEKVIEELLNSYSLRTLVQCWILFAGDRSQ